MLERECSVEGRLCKIEAVRADKFFGHGVNVKVLTLEGTLLNNVGFSCHPGFEDYERFQRMSTEELLDHVVERLQSGRYDTTLEDLRTSGFMLFLRFNSPDATVPNGTTQGSG